MDDVKSCAAKILECFQMAERLIGKTGVRFSSESGTISRVFLDEDHGLTFQFKADDGTSIKWPISSIKYVVD